MNILRVITCATVSANLLTVHTRVTTTHAAHSLTPKMTKLVSLTEAPSQAPPPLINVTETLTRSLPAAPVAAPSQAQQIESAVQAPIFQCIRFHENTNSYTWGWPRGTGDGGGVYQFEPQTWAYASQLPGALGGAWGSASPLQQDAAALALSRAQGFGAWADDGCVS